MRTITRRSFAAATTLLAAGTLAACGESDDTGTAAGPAASAPAASAMPSTMAGAAQMVGPGCADYAAKVPQGAGSVAGMAQDPVAVAAGNNPLLTTLTAAVSGQLNPKVNLVDTLNGGEFTVFAPIDSAFAKLDAKTVDTLKRDDALLSTILTYHVVSGRLSPSELTGTQKTVQGASIEVTGSGDMVKINDASVVCGGVQTSNATVYLIDAVLMPT